MKYNIGFTLGDPGGDGHACTTDYHIVANHSADEYPKHTRKLLNAAIAEDIKVKQNEIASIQTQIEFNQQVAEDNSKYISKLKDLIS